MPSLRRTKMAAKKLKEECKKLKEECKEWKEECKQEWKEECKQEWKEWKEECKELAKLVGKVVPLVTAGGKFGLIFGGPPGAIFGLCVGCSLGIYILQAEVEDRVAINAAPPIADIADLLKNIDSEAMKKLLEAAGSS